MRRVRWWVAGWQTVFGGWLVPLHLMVNNHCHSDPVKFFATLQVVAF